MKQLAILFIGFQFMNLNAQSKIQPIISVNYSHELEFIFDHLYTNKIDLNGGIRIKEHVFLDIGLGVALGENRKISSLQIRSLTNSIGINYRILKSKHIFSPMIGANFGYEISSNARAKYVSSDYDGIVDKNNIYADPKFIYNKNIYFSRFKVLLDVEYKNISLRTGPNFNFSSFDQTNFEYKYGQTNFSKSTRTNVLYLNIGIEAGMIYTFPMKNKGPNTIEK